MKPIQIMAMLDLALAARKAGKVFNPMFTGEAGLGKSEICQAWVKKQRQKNPVFLSSPTTTKATAGLSTARRTSGLLKAKVFSSSRNRTAALPAL
jgi:chromosomal replication initiation ATPase DnaA